MKHTPLKSMSKERKRESRIYTRQGIKFLAANPHCLACVRIFVASGKQIGRAIPAPATQIHHMMGRVGPLYLDERHWMQVCMKCHNWAHANPILAEQYGVSISRHEQEEADDGE